MSRTHTTEPVFLDETDRRIINQMQSGFPLSEQPYLEVATQLGLSEGELLTCLQLLLDRGALSRFGPLYQVERMGGEFLLAALEVPPERFEAVAAQVNVLPQVAHNYARNHRLNMWFVLACESALATGEAIAAIEAATGLTVHAFPKEQEYFIGMHLDV
jgi:DNA-binding Lrp family transcriptional regulator